MITLTYTQYFLLLLACLAAGLATFIPTRAYYRLYITRNKDLRRQIEELTSTGHHMDADQWKDLQRQLSERTALVKQDQEIGLFLRQYYSQAQLDQHRGLTTAEVVVMRLRQGGGG